MPTPEDPSRNHINRALEQAGWRAQDYKSTNLNTGEGVFFRDFPIVSGHGFADYLLYVDGKAAGVSVEAYPLTCLPVSDHYHFSIRAPSQKRDSQTGSTPNLAAARWH